MAKVRGNLSTCANSVELLASHEEQHITKKAQTNFNLLNIEGSHALRIQLFTSAHACMLCNCLKL